MVENSDSRVVYAVHFTASGPVLRLVKIYYLFCTCLSPFIIDNVFVFMDFTCKSVLVLFRHLFILLNCFKQITTLINNLNVFTVGKNLIR